MALFSPAAPLRFFIFIFVIALLCLNSCSPPKSYLELPDNHYPLFIDDSDKDSLLTAINHQLNFLKNYPADKTITIGQQSLTYDNLTDSLQTFSEIIVQNPSPFELDEIIRNNFNVVANSFLTVLD